MVLSSVISVPGSCAHDLAVAYGCRNFVNVWQCTAVFDMLLSCCTVSLAHRSRMMISPICFPEAEKSAKTNNVFVHRPLTVF